MGAIIAAESQAVGLNWVLAPVVDVNNNPDNPVINVRAFAETPELVSQLTTAFIQGAQSYPVLTTAKHFPGHGDTAVDSHLDLPVLSHSPERLRQVELPPFAQAIAAGVDTVMSAHLLIPALDPTYPATLSPPILTGCLRQQLGFTGLIVTDALVMGAISHRYGADEAAVLALEAGADILLMPPDPAGVIEAVCAAVKQGRLTPERILASVERVWRAKTKVFTPPTSDFDQAHDWEQIPPLPLQLTHLARPESWAIAAEILQDSRQVQPAPQPLQRSPEIPLRNLVIVDSLLACEYLGNHAPAISLPHQRGYQLQVVDNHTPEVPLTLEWQPRVLTLLQLFIRGNPFRGSAGLTERASAWFEFLVQTQQLQALVIYGSPYTLQQFLPTLPVGIPYVFTYGQMPLAQADALQAILPR
ncbi:glycoside hydrolase family 3 N-terminal domain-containing protein [Neosynechococcus sphagnicola]|uniref:glycoside hydrolase family 3 N-terminal domain-containing protein n=1 Tax=Neosynechococcus sphagnicola TaxID=1501145 RepID=UPI00308467DA